MNKKVGLFISLSIAAALGVGGVFAAYSVTDNASPFGARIRLKELDGYYLQIDSGDKLVMAKSTSTLPSGYLSQYEIETDVTRGNIISFYKGNEKITTNIVTGGTSNNVRGNNEHIIVRSSEEDSRVYLRIKEDQTFDVWATDYETEYKRIFLNSGGSTYWDVASSEFYIHSWINNEDEGFNADVKLNTTDTANLYYADIDVEHDMGIFLRIKPGTGKVVWSNEEGLWNKTSNLTISDSKDTYTITGWNEDDGTWSTHTCTPGELVQEAISSPTCEEDGSHYEIHNCIYCGKQISKDLIVDPATGHDYSVTYSFNDDHSKCTATGICRNDGSHVLNETVGTSYSVITDPTCHSEGVGRYSAIFTNTNLGTTYEDVPIPMISHNFSSDWSTSSTHHWHACLSSGCTEISNYAPHSGGVASESEWGCCEVCGEPYIAPLGHTHSMSEVTYNAPSCTEDGNIHYFHCSGCNKYYSSSEGLDVQEINPESIVIPKTGHNLNEGSVTLAPTCTEDGVFTKSCTNPNCTYHEDTPIAALGHEMDAGTQTKDPTCTEAGALTKHCTHDGCTHTVVETIPALGHSYGTDHYCTRCGSLDPEYVKVTFKVNYNTYGDGDLYFLSNVFGWSKSSTTLMTWNDGNNWTFTCVAKINSSIEYKFCRSHQNSGDEWESFDGNRSYTFKTNTTVTLSWGINS